MRTILVEPVQGAPAVTHCTLGDWFVRFLAPKLAFCYPEALEPERIAQALSRVLRDYGVFAGRISLHGSSLSIEHAACAIPLEIAQRRETLRELVIQTNASVGDPLCPTLQLMRANWGRAPLFAARLTQAADGCALGVTWHHSIGDLHSCMLFLRAWSRACSGLAYEAPFETSDRAAYLAETITDSPNAQSELRVAEAWETVKLGWLANIGMPRVNLAFDWEALQAINAAVSPKGDSTVDDALWAYVFGAIRRLIGQTVDPDGLWRLLVGAAVCRYTRSLARYGALLIRSSLRRTPSLR